MTDSIKRFTLEELSGSTDKYIVPLYQRAYAWTQKEIRQLIDDINDFDEEQYYLGSLIVHKREDAFEVIDGQQRLTTLYLLFTVLDKQPKNDFLKFECREKSNYTLKNLKNPDINDEFVEYSLINGKRIFEEFFNTPDAPTKEEFFNKLSKVIINRIEVPENTDLNRYFEIMNTRGEQLEQSDIVKANLMKNLDEADQNAFAVIWNAVSDMSGYVQMHFSKNIREKLFLQKWEILQDDAIEIIKHVESRADSEVGSTISDILKDGWISNETDDSDADGRIRFESIIEFPFFLLHVLKIYVCQHDIKTDGGASVIGELLDDKKLIVSFESVMGGLNGQSISKKEFSRDFIILLLKCRFLFDKFIIKRDTPLNDDKSVWSIKSLSTSERGSNKKAYYFDTKFNNKNERDRHAEAIMIQSALRVSYTSPKVMHWITELLTKIIELNDGQSGEIVNTAEKIACRACKSYIEDNNRVSNDGVNTPHIVFNYLDYLLWEKEKDKYKDFVFEFRNSVEHWYPQHPSQQTFKEWDGVNRFGNLCLLQREVNSKFSNMSPLSKKNTWKDKINSGSLKLRVMADNTIDDYKWKNGDCEKHETEMLNILNERIMLYCPENGT